MRNFRVSKENNRIEDIIEHYKIMKMKNLFLTIAFLITAVVSMDAQTVVKKETFEDKSDLYVGYQYTNTDAVRLKSIRTFRELNNDTSSHGFNVGLTYYGNRTRSVGVILETATTFGDRHVVTALTGIQAKARNHTFQPFARGLVGFGGSVDKERTGTNREYGLAVGGGAGLDIRLSDKVALRVASVDYIRMNTFRNNVRDTVRFGAGLTF